MTKKTMRSLKTGKNCYKVSAGFTLHYEGPGRWKVSGKDLSGKYRRIRFTATSKTEAVRVSRELLKQPVSSATEDFPTIAIADALIRSAQARPWKTTHTRQTDRYTCGYFLDWIDKRGLTFWHELRFEHVEAYQAELVLRGLAPWSIKHYLKPVRRAAKWIVANWPGHYHDICACLHQSAGVRREIAALSIHEVLGFLDWLVRKKPCQCRKRCECVKTQQLYDRIIPGIALQGLAGLQLQEAQRLTWDKIDFRQGTVRIDGLVKNSYRLRLIPIPQVVLWLLRRRRESICGQEESLFSYRSYSHYSKAVKKALRGYANQVLAGENDGLAEKICSLPPKDLRNTLQTAATEGGWFGYYLQRYVGHAPGTTSQKFYCADRVQDLLPNFHKYVLSPLEAEIETWPGASTPAILPGPRLLQASNR